MGYRVYWKQNRKEKKNYGENGEGKPGSDTMKFLKYLLNCIFFNALLFTNVLYKIQKIMGLTN